MLLFGWFLRIITGCIYSSVVAFSYIYVIVPNFGYQGFVAENISFGIPLYLVLTSLSFLLLPSEIRKPSVIFGLLYYLVVFVPGTLIAIFLDSGWMLRVSLLLLPIALVRLLSSLPPLKINFVFFRSRLLFGICLFFVFVFSYGILFQVFGFQSPAGLDDVYSVRLNARDVLANSIYGVAHLLRLLSNVLNPLILIFGLMTKRYSLVLISIIGQIIIFTFDATKSTLLSPLMIFAFYVALVFGGRRAVVLAVGGLAVLMLLCIVIDFIFFEDWKINYLFVRRFVLMPGYLSNLYFDFFTNNPFFNWGGRFGLADNYSGYSSPGFLIGDVVYGKLEGNANANFLVDAFSHYGVVGVFIAIFVLGLFFWVYDSVANMRDKIFGCLMLIMPSFSLVNTGLESSMFTHGLLFSLFAVWVVPKSYAN